MKNIKAYIPNAITVFRCICTAVFISSILSNNIPLALISFGIGAGSDAADGYLARKWKVESKFGKIADPIADKLLGFSTLVYLGLSLTNLIFIPVILEGAISLINAMRFSKKRESEVDIKGKIKTVALFPTGLVGLLNVIYPQLTPVFIPLLTALITLQLSTVKEYIKKYVNENKKEEIFISKEKEEEEPQKKEKRTQLVKLIDNYKNLKVAALNLKKLSSNPPIEEKNLEYKKGPER
jgi:CDP-diacylglycerol--glycerol-3-phosphate 3-phosphatidyltransferase